MAHQRLRDLLKQRHLEPTSIVSRLGIFRLAVRLATSLYTLCQGPWIQQEWTADYLQIRTKDGVSPVDMLEEAFIACSFSQCHEGRRDLISGGPLRSQVSDTAKGKQSATDEICPRFFLSFAQLLIDIEKGRGRDAAADDETPQMQFRRLVREARLYKKDKVTEFYGQALEGCLLYLENYKSEAQYTEDERSRKREVIKKSIVRNLKDHLYQWEQQQYRDAKNRGGLRDENNEPSGGGDDGEMESVAESFLTLWGDADDDYSTVPYVHCFGRPITI